MQIQLICKALRRKVLPHAPRDDWGSETEKMCQLLEAFEKEFGEESIDFSLMIIEDPPHS